MEASTRAATVEALMAGQIDVGLLETTDARLGIAVNHSPDMVSSKLPALRAYQHSLQTPPPPAGRRRW